MLPIESKVDYLLCSESVVIFLIPLFVAMHLFVDLLMSTLVTTILMWFVYVVVTNGGMWF
jgi:hypothetical protein